MAEIPPRAPTAMVVTSSMSEMQSQSKVALPGLNQ